MGIDVEIVAENHFKGLMGKLVSEVGNKVEVIIQLANGNEFKYVGSLQDLRNVEDVMDVKVLQES